MQDWEKVERGEGDDAERARLGFPVVSLRRSAMNLCAGKWDVALTPPNRFFTGWGGGVLVSWEMKVMEVR